MNEERKKPWYLQLPAKIGAVVVFMVAVTTLVGNLMELDQKRRATAATPTPAAVAPVATAQDAQPAAAAGPLKLRVGLDRIAVEHDGSPGTTDWRFTVEADGQPLFAFQQDDLDDTGGRNVAVPRDVATTLRLEPGNGAKLTVKGWRGSRFRLPGTEPDATGTGMLTPTGGIAPIRVAAGEAGAGTFVFYLSADAL